MPPILPGSTIGILGGGQLGRMTAMAARSYGYRVQVLDPDPSCPARFVVDACFEASWDDAREAAALARGSDVVTLEIEQISIASLDAAAQYAPVRPGANILEVIQDRIAQRSWLVEHGFPTGDHRAATSGAELAAALHDFDNDVFIKAARGGYDGRSQLRLTPVDPRLQPGDSGLSKKGASAPELAEGIFRDDFKSHPVIVERALHLAEEISVLVARRPSGESVVYSPAANHHEHQILEWSVLPAQLPPEITRRATEIAASIAHEFALEGLLVVELFLLKNGELLVNELAPRPHNSYHQSERACITSQFEQHVRAICDLPLGSPQIIRPAAIVNLLGDLWLDQNVGLDKDDCHPERSEGPRVLQEWVDPRLQPEDPRPAMFGASASERRSSKLETRNSKLLLPNFAAALTVPEVRLHLYEKHLPRLARKMGHLSASADTPEEAVRRVLLAKQLLRSGTRF